jgi:uncharacterized protein (DUF58 family)
VVSARVGWTIAALAIAVGYTTYGWPGVVLGVTIVVFWLLLSFSRAMRVMRGAAHAPVGHVPSAVMLNAKLRAGMRLLDIVQLTRSLGEAVSDQPEVWRWRDEGGAAVRVTLVRGRVTHWALERESPAGAGLSRAEAGSIRPGSGGGGAP